MKELAKIIIVATMASSPVLAGEAILGVGADGLQGGPDAAAVWLEYRTDPLHAIGPVELRFGAAGEVDGDGDAWGGAGLVATAPLGDGLDSGVFAHVERMFGSAGQGACR